ncbi:MAG: hypothetical protein KOO62_01605 [candidate division Zixibacteria bacterium]|nr:hypothetical protein [candidate division Zixibacteria bacterium]
MEKLRSVVFVLTLLALVVLSVGCCTDICEVKIKLEEVRASFTSMAIANADLNATMLDIIVAAEKHLGAEDKTAAAKALNGLAVVVVSTRGDYFADDLKTVGPILDAIIVTFDKHALPGLAVDGPHNDRQCDENNKCGLEVEFWTCYEVGNGCAHMIP